MARFARFGTVALLLLALAPRPLSAEAERLAPENAPLVVGPIRSFETEQGLRVVIVRQPKSGAQRERAFVGVYSSHGRTSEAVPGLAHMAEHVFANAAGLVRDFEVPADLERIDSNAQARPDYISAWVTVEARGVVPAALRRSSGLWGIDANDELIEHQRKRVIAELEKARSYGSWVASEGLEHACYGGRPGADAEIEHTRAYTAALIRDYIRHGWDPSRAVLVIAGDVDPVEVESALQKAFAKRAPIESGTVDPASLVRPVVLSKEPTTVIRRSPEAGTTWVSAGILAPPVESDQYLAMLILDQFLMGGRQEFENLWRVQRDMQSPVGRHLGARGQLHALSDGRGYGAASPPLAERDPAYFEIQFETDPAAVEELETRLREALRNARSEMSDESIDRARRELLHFYRQWLGYDNLRPLGDHLAGMSFRGDDEPRRLLNLHEELSEITPEQVRNVMDRWVLDGEIRFSILISD